MSTTRHVFIDCGIGSSESRVEVDGDASLEDMLDAFGRYLRQCGYVFDGSVQIQSDNTEGRGEPVQDA